MSTLRIPVAVGACAAALCIASTSLADDEMDESMSSPPTKQHITVRPEVEAPQAPPTSTTTTTSGPYRMNTGDYYTERVVERTPNEGLLSAGVGFFVLSYGASVVGAAVSDREADQRLFIPVVGPWMDLSDRGCGWENPCGPNEDIAQAMLVTSGIVQGASALMILGALVIPETIVIEERATAKAKEPPKASVTVTPLTFRAGAGIGAVGRF